MVLRGNASAMPLRRVGRLLSGISALALGAGLALPQPLHAADTTITNTIVSTPQTVSGSIGQYSITGTGTLTSTADATLIDLGTIGTLTNQGKILNTASIGTALWNTSSIGSIVNSGTISAVGIAILNSLQSNSSGPAPTIGAISNSGVILGSETAAIANAGGTIGTITNSGTIKAPIAIYSSNDGTLPAVILTIVNSRLIAGNIFNTGSALTINGAAGSGIGTLTGFQPATRGTIESSQNVVFGSGNLLLDDDITAVGKTVVNQGAAITLTSPGIVTGNFSQTAGKLVLGTLVNLAVTGKATISGGTVVASVSNTGNYIAGNAISTLISAGDISSYGGVSIATTLANGLAARGTTSGNNLLLVASNDFVGGTLATLTNSGTISGALYAVVVESIGSIGTLANSGVLSGNSRGILVNIGGHIGTVTNNGRIVAVGGAGAAGGIANVGNIDSIVNTGTISSGASSGIGNNLSSGSIGQITNSGLISAATGGIYSEGTLGTLNNSGEIVGAQGLSITGGTVGLINNSGTIRGITALFVSSGSTLGPITNSGVIAGNIIYRSPNGLTITGGAGGAIGTLTGTTLTNRGTITNTVSNVVLAGGSLLLNDHVNVTGRTLVNAGATVYLNATDTVTGAFNQTGGTLIVAPTQGGLIVSGAATIAGTVLSNFATTGNYLQGTYTMVRGATLGLGGATVSSNTITGVSSALDTVGNSLQLTMSNDYVGGTLATLTNSAAITGAETGLYVASTGSIGTLTNSGTFGGRRFGVNNLGTIGTFANSGLVTNVAFTALWNQGNIGQLVNSGTITNSSWAILNDGSIGTLTNAGVIAGAGNAIQNNGAIGLLRNAGTMSGGLNAIAGNFATIVNAGVIRGDVNGNGGTIGTIIGGSGGTVGTFTGFDGSTQGKIGASTNLTFASGALLLNDTIVAANIAPAAITVSNTGADLALSTIVTIDANYRQTAGVLALGSAGRLVVSQAATFSGGTISVTVGGGNANATYRVGDAVGGPLVTGGAGSTYTGVSIAATGGIAGLNTTGKASGTDLVLAANNIYVGDTQGSVGNSGTISEVSYGLYVANSGAVGTLVNSGILNGSADGLNNNGSIGALTNSGRISGAQKGLGNQATIGTLTNVSGGTILGGTAAGLQNDTALGTLINAGVLSSGSAGFANYGSMGGLANSGTINGGPQAIYNAGTISGTLANTGSITSGQSGIGQSGVVATLINSGFIGGGSNGINLGGTIGTLINQAGGTISGGFALYLDGSLGSLSNSGLIRGNIQNAVANPLTISGGIGGAVGTLTGQSGKGTITSTLANILFSSGALLLNDNIVATGRTVSNAGASLALNTLVSLTGNYSQTGGTLAIDSTLGGLLVSGAATFSGGTVLSSLSATGNYLQSISTLVGASSLGLSGSLVSINSVTGLARDWGVIGNRLLLTIANDYVGGTLATLGNGAAITAASTGLYVATTGSIGTVSNTGTFGGQQFGVNNRGTIATLSNAGRITNANFTALWNQGSIGRLVNSGTITNSSWAILNSGTIGTLTNSGVISGAGIAVQNNAVITLLDNRGTLSGGSAIAGTFTTLANSGLIRGNINPSGGVIGTIIGGSGGTVGTFTGASGTVQGTFGASANLTFASGALLLNDTVLAVGTPPGSLTISNVGADIALGAIVTIGANYRQTAGMLGLGSFGALVVTQAAAMSGATIAASLAGLSATSSYLVGGGAARTLVAGGAGSSYAGVNLLLSGGLTGLRVNGVGTGTDYVLTAGNDYIGDAQGTIVNSGTIGGVTYALYVASSGSVGTLLNSGTLSGTATGLVNRGSIGTLSNSGRIDGPIGLHNYGTITAFENSGTVVANGAVDGIGVFSANMIANFVNDGAISGGSGSGSTGIVNAGTIGTLSNRVGGTIGQGTALGTGILNYGLIGRVANMGLVTGSRNGFSNGGTIGWFDNKGTVDTGSTSSFTGLVNRGTIGTLTNSGRIAASAGLFNFGGTIGFLINQPDGVIAGGNALYSTGSIGMLSNSGTILSSGAGNAVSVLGTLGTLVNAGSIVSDTGYAVLVTAEGWLGGIANSGVIRGDIWSLSPHALTISAGVGQTTGTFTGIAGGRGQIINTASDLVFSSGALLLNDDLDLNGAHTAFNAGATLTLSPDLSIYGNFTQSAGLLALVPGEHALTVTGSVALTGGTVLADLASTGNYLAGDSILLIAGGVGSSYGGATLTGAPTGVRAIADVSGTSLVERFANSYVGGALRSLSNSGTISSPTAVYIAATGSLGRLVNTGLIAGDILNLSANALTISGGTFNTIGTLTGQSGQGRITSTLANVVLDSGNLWLNDSVDVGTGTLVNSGATVALTGTVSVTGAFTQTGGTLSVARNAGRLVTSGAAVLNGGSVEMTGFSATGNYLVGENGGVVVEGGAGSSYTDLYFETNIGGLELAGITLGNTLQAKIANNYVGGTLGSIDNQNRFLAYTGAFIAASGVLGTFSNSGSMSQQVAIANLGSIDVISNTGTIDAGLTAISNVGRIGTLSNHGLLSSVSAAVFNGGTIQTLVNSGTLVRQFAGGLGTSGAIVNLGTIGVLSNTGFIGGPIAVFNIQSLGTIANSGTMAGDIVNQSAQDLVFTGAGEGSVGVLRGNGSDGQGLISNTLGNVVFAAGNILLDDAVMLGAGTLINAGAAVTLVNSVSVTGNYAQATGTLALGLSSLLVSGVANISGGLITTDQLESTGNYLVGASGGTLVRAGTGSAYQGVSVTSGITGLAVATRVGTIGSTVDLLLTITNDYVGTTLGNLDNSGTITGVSTAAYIAGTGHLGTLANTGRLEGNLYGLRNLGSIGRVDNAGTITGWVGLFNAGTIDTIFNRGSLTDFPTVLAAGLNNDGRIGAVVNEGLISGAARGLFNSGTIGRIVNSGTISGPLALYNGGSIATIDNSGWILDSAGPDSAALNNAGHLDTLVNRGTMFGETYGVFNSGTIGQFTNSGRIDAPVAIHIADSGVLGPLVNTGVLAGNIDNLSAQALTITGGSFVAAGTLTGFDGTRGTITSTLADVVFASGVQLLGDDIVATGHVVRNEGALIGLAATTSITGGYRQASGGLYLLGGPLVVEGVANLTGGTVATRLPSAVNYLAGSIAATLVRGGAGSSYAGVEVDTGDTPGLALRGGASGSDLVVTALNHYIGGTLASLTNSGSIASGYGLFVAESGSLGSVTNSGTLAGSIAAIHNDGTLGPIINTGVIAGNIDNLSAQALQIRGGTLTGYAPDSQGTITSNQGDVVLGGTIVLNHAFAVGSNTVINDGGLLRLGTVVTVTGNFSQSSGLVMLDSGAMLAVSGAASFTGGTIATASEGDGNYLVGGSAGTLVRGGTGSTYTGVTVSTGNRPGLNQGAQVSGNDLVLAALNDYIGGTLGRLSNTGSLSSDYAVFIAATGSLGSLVNSGTLAGSIAAIHNAGTLGPITNTGVIAGNIDNLSAQALSITGGTLTGFTPGSQGTIGSTLGNVVLAGTITLDDAIDVGSNTVVNAGGTLSLARGVAVTGGFRMQEGVLALGTGVSLAVSGSASITGGTVTTTVPVAANYRAGGVVGTLVQGGAGSNYTGVTVTTGTTPGLALSAGADGTNLVVGALNHYVGATLGSLTNSGSVAQAYPVYVATTGSLGSLANSGTLSGSIAAIYTAGTLGQITNSGLIAGNIENASAQGLRIAGGTGTVFGTLTGHGAGRGTISSANAPVAFTAGNLLLDDDIVATGLVVSNTGAVLRLVNSASITGGYSQTAGELALASGTRLVVSGTASLTGGTVSTSFASTATYLAGSPAGTLVQGGTGSSYTGVGVVTGSVAGLALGAGASGTNLVVTALNDYVGGSLGNLSNTGTLAADYPVYIAATGTLGSLANSGTLSGTIAAIRNLGLIGPIANTGVIAGNIASDATADLAIAGGAGTVFGTLTGFAAGSQGTITNTGGDLLLSGNLLLDDAINVGGRTVRVAGGTLAINAPVAVTGNYNQTGGKLLIGVTSTTAYGQLLVNGSASLTGTNVTLVKLGTNAISAGQAYTVVKANGALTFSNLTSSVTGLTGTFSSAASNGANGLVLTLSEPVGTITPPPPASFTGTGLQAGGPGVGTGAALDAIADAGGPAAIPVNTDVLLPLSQLPSGEQQRAIVQLAPTQLTPQVIAVAVSPAVNAIVQHQDVLAANATGREERGLAAGSQGQRGAMWGQVLVSAAKRDNVSAASPYRASSYGVMIGTDLNAASKLAVGGAISWVNSTADGRGAVAGSRTELDSFQATGYFTWQPGDLETAGFAIDGQLGFGYNHYKQRRRIDFLGATARASFDGQQYLGNLRASYTIPLSATTSVTPYASLREVHLHNAAYRETGAGAANLSVRKLDVDALSHEIGFQGAGIFEGGSGRFAPTFRLGWMHTYDNGPIPLTAVLGGVAFTSTAARGAADGAAVGAGLAFQSSDRFRIAVQYDGDLRRDFRSHSGTLKMTVTF